MSENDILLGTLKHSLYIDGDYEDEFLNYLLSVSRETIESALDYEPDREKAKYKHAVVLLAGHYYANRTETAESVQNNIPYGVASLVHQLRASETARAELGGVVDGENFGL